MFFFIFILDSFFYKIPPKTTLFFPVSHVSRNTTALTTNTNTPFKVEGSQRSHGAFTVHSSPSTGIKMSRQLAD